jgi:hypothetical protein
MDLSSKKIISLATQTSEIKSISWKVVYNLLKFMYSDDEYIRIKLRVIRFFNVFTKQMQICCQNYRNLLNAHWKW